MLKLDSLAAGFLVTLVTEAGLNCCALLANYNIFDFVIYLLLRLKGIKTLAHLTANVFKLMKQMTIVHVTCLNHCLG